MPAMFDVSPSLAPMAATAPVATNATVATRLAARWLAAL
jgi:hypothetical protein